MGVYILDPIAWDYLEPGRSLPMPDLLEIHAPAAATTSIAYRQECYWLDIGRHDDYDLANEIFESRRSQFLGDRRGRGTQDRARPVNDEILGQHARPLDPGGPGRLPDRGDPLRLPDRARGQGDRHPHGRLGQPGGDQRRPHAGPSLFLARPGARPAQGVAADAGLPLARPVGSRRGTGGLAGPGRAGGDPGSYVSGLSEVSRRQGGRDQPGRVLALDPVSCAVAVVVFGVVLVDLRATCRWRRSWAASGFVAAHFVREARALESRAYCDEPILDRRRGPAGGPPSLQPRSDPGGHRESGELPWVDAGADEGSAPTSGPPVPPSGRSASSWRSAWSCSRLRRSRESGWSVSEPAGRSRWPAPGRCGRPIASRRVSSGWTASPSPRRATAGRHLPAIQSPADLPGRSPIDKLLIDRRDPARGASGRRGHPGPAVRRARAPGGRRQAPGAGLVGGVRPRGKQVGSRHLAGFYPDDLAASPDGRFLFVLCSGRSEGDEKKPLPALDVIAIGREDRPASSRGPASPSTRPTIPSV